MRFWLTVMIFALLNVLTWFVYHRWHISDRHLLTVEEFSPGDGQLLPLQRDEVEAKGPSGPSSPVALFSRFTCVAPLSFRFNLPMSIHEDLMRHPPGRCEPALAGMWKWQSPQELTFTPSNATLATAYSVTLDRHALHARSGNTLAAPFHATFRTLPLTAWEVHVLQAMDDGTYKVQIEFSDSVAEAEAAAAITLVEADGSPLGVRQWSSVGRFLTLTTEQLRGANVDQHAAPVGITVTIKAGLLGRSGTLGLEQASVTHLVLDSTLRLENVKGFSDEEGSGGTVRLSFNHPIHVADLRKVLRVDPPVAFTLVDGTGSMVTMRGAFAWGQRYAIVLDRPSPGMVGTFPLSERAPVWIPDQNPEAWFTVAAGRLGSLGNRTLELHAVNLRAVTVQAWRLYEGNLVNWTAARYRNSVSALGHPVMERRITIGDVRNTTSHISLALDRELPPGASGDGVLLFAVTCLKDDYLVDDARADWYFHADHPSQIAVSLSDLALSCRRGVDGCTVWVTSLASAQPVANVRLRLYSTKFQQIGTALSDATGLAHLVEGPMSADEAASVVIADSPAGGLTWLDLEHRESLRDPTADTGGVAWERERLSAFIHAERGVWRPGDTVHLRAVVRTPTGEPPAPLPLRWRIVCPDMKVWKEVVQTTLVSGDTLYDLALPNDLPTGQWSAQLTLPGDDRLLGEVPVQIEDYVPDRLTISFRHEGPGIQAATAQVSGQPPDVLAHDGPITLRAQADYLFGRPASGRTLTAWVRLDPETWQPVGESWRGWTFADQAESIKVIDHVTVAGTRIDLPAGIADAQGGYSWNIDAEKLIHDLDPSRTRPWRLECGGEVHEVGGRAVFGSAPVLTMHPTRTWLGAQLLEDGATTTLALRTAGINGDPSPGTAKIRIYSETWNTILVRQHGITSYQSTREFTPQGDVVAVEVGKQGAHWQVPSDLPAGTYVICAEWQTTRQMVSLYYRPGTPAGWRESISRERPDHCDISVRQAPAAAIDGLAGAPEVAPTRLDPGAPVAIGSDVLVALRSPFPGQALLTVCTDRVIATRVLTLTGNALEVRLPVTQEWSPNAFVCVEVIRRVEASKTLRLHRAWGVARVLIESSSRRLAVNLEAPAGQAPGMPLTVSGTIHDAAGAAVPGASVTIAAVDEGILRLTGYRTPDPFAWLIRPRGLGVEALDVFSDLIPELERPGGESPTGGDGDRRLKLARYQSPITARRVLSVAAWSGLLIADANGRIHCELPVPASFNGRLRLMAVAADGPRAGMAEGWCTIRGPLVLQTSWPRFAAPGDRFRVSASVTNLSGGNGRLRARLILADDGLLSSTATQEEQDISSGSQVQVSFNVQVGDRSGVAHAQVVAEIAPTGAGETVHASDEVELPVRPGSPRITLGGEDPVSVGKPGRVTLPDGFIPGSGSVEVRLSARPALSMPRGFQYLYNYPYGCLEQVTSGCFPLVYLRDLGDQIAPKLFAPEGIDRRLSEGIARLQTMETEGGLAVWPGERGAWPWGTVYATHFLVEAKRAGHAVPEEFLRRMLKACQHLETENEWRWAETQAYACYVLAIAGQPQHAMMQRIGDLIKVASQEAEIGPSARFWLAAAWMESGRADLAKELVPQRLAGLRQDRHLDGDLASPLRDRAVMLASLLDVDPDHPAIAGLAHDLTTLAPWASTQDTAFALFALGRYARQALHEPPPASMSLLVDGRVVDVPATNPTRVWTGTTATTLAANIEGDANSKAWLSWEVTGVPTKPPADSEHGLKVERHWLDEKGLKIVGRPIHSGDLVRVEITVTSDHDCKGVVVEDLLPAGLEIENPRLLSTATIQLPPDGSEDMQEHCEMRDDRFVDMEDLRYLHGTWQLSTGYLARAVTQGTFTRPPVRVECMYDIAVNGIAGTGVVTIGPPP